MKHLAAYNEIYSEIFCDGWKKWKAKTIFLEGWETREPFFMCKDLYGKETKPCHLMIAVHYCLDVGFIFHIFSLLLSFKKISIETKTWERKLTLEFNPEFIEMSIFISVDFASVIWYTGFLIEARNIWEQYMYNSLHTREA